VYKDISSSSLSESNKEHLKSSVDDYEYHRENDDSDIKVPNTIGSSFKQMIENHYENWITTKNPSLGNKTPLQFAKTKKGKEMIKELLREMENELARNNKSDLPPFPFERVKERLGL